MEGKNPTKAVIALLDRLMWFFFFFGNFLQPQRLCSLKPFIALLFTTQSCLDHDSVIFVSIFPICTDYCPNPCDHISLCSDTCPNPSITKFFPASGPKEGGTDVTIEGLNLGQKYEDIKDGVLVAGIVCVPYKGNTNIVLTNAQRF